jgi:hypothetical protein
MVCVRPIKCWGRVVALAAAAAMVASSSVPSAGAAILGGAAATVATASPATPPQQGRLDAVNGFKNGDPTAGIDLIQAPQPDSFGNAQVSVPITLPPGRNGLQPQPSIS